MVLNICLKNKVVDCQFGFETSSMLKQLYFWIFQQYSSQILYLFYFNLLYESGAWAQETSIYSEAHILCLTLECKKFSRLDTAS